MCAYDYKPPIFGEYVMGFLIDTVIKFCSSSVKMTRVYKAKTKGVASFEPMVCGECP